MTEDAGNNKVVAEVNILDEILETPEDIFDDLAAELKNEEKKAGKKKIAQPVVQVSVNKTAKQTKPPPKRVRVVKKIVPTEGTVQNQPVLKITRLQAKKAGVVPVKPTAAITRTATSIPKINTATTKTPAKTPNKIPAKPLVAAAKTDKSPVVKEPVVTKTPVKVVKKPLTKPTATPGGNLVARIPAVKSEDKSVAEASKSAVEAKSVKKVQEPVTKSVKVEKPDVKDAAKPVKKTVDNKTVGVKTAAKKEAEESREPKGVKCPSNDGDEGEGDRLNVTVTSDEIGEGDDAVEYDTRSEASSSSDISDASSSDLSSPLTTSSSISSTSISDADDRERRRSRSHRRKRRHEISPIVYDRRSRSGERSPKRSKVSSSVSRKDYSAKLKYLFRDARFYLIKSNNHENVVLSKAKGVWSTPPQNEAKLNQAYRESRNVILIFSVKESGKFQGFARVSGESRRDVPPIQWVLPPGLSARALGGVFHLDWICRRELPFPKTQHLYNAWNDGKPVKIGRDGQEIEPKVAEELCRLFPVDENVDINEILHKSKRASRGRPRSWERRHDRRHERHHHHHLHHRHHQPSYRDSSARRRSHHPEDDYGPRTKRSRNEYYEGMYKDGRHDRPALGRYGMRRDSIMNGGYHDYVRDFHSRPPLPPMAFGPPQPYPPMEPPPYYRGPPHPDFGMRSNRPDKRSYERSVDDFLRRTAHPSRSDRRYRDRR